MLKKCIFLKEVSQVLIISGSCNLSKINSQMAENQSGLIYKNELTRLELESILCSLIHKHELSYMYLASNPGLPSQFFFSAVVEKNY